MFAVVPVDGAAALVSECTTKLDLVTPLSPRECHGSEFVIRTPADDNSDNRVGVVVVGTCLPYPIGDASVSEDPTVDEVDVCVQDLRICRILVCL